MDRRQDKVGPRDKYVSDAAMAARSVQGTSNYQPRKNNTRRPQMEQLQTGLENVRISHNTHTHVCSEQPRSHLEAKTRNATSQNPSYGKPTTSKERSLPKCSGGQQGPNTSSTSAQGTYKPKRQPRGKPTRRSHESQANDDPRVQTVRSHLDRGEKVLIMMRGCPGSGKSTLARQLQFDGVILSTDDFFVSDDGRYLYEQEKIGDAHEWNKQRALKNMNDGVSPIIIDNTNIKTWDMKPYVVSGNERGYKVEIFEPNTPWQFRPGELARRNSHGVPMHRIVSMIDRYERNVTVEQILQSSDRPRTAVRGTYRQDRW